MLATFPSHLYCISCTKVRKVSSLLLTLPGLNISVLGGWKREHPEHFSGVTSCDWLPNPFKIFKIASVWRDIYLDLWSKTPETLLGTSAMQNLLDRRPLNSSFIFLIVFRLSCTKLNPNSSQILVTCHDFVVGPQKRLTTGKETVEWCCSHSAWHTALQQAIGP